MEIILSYMEEHIFNLAVGIHPMIYNNIFNN